MPRFFAQSFASAAFVSACFTLASCTSQQPRTTSDALVELTVSPANLSLVEGATAQLKLVGTYADGLTADLTLDADWSVDNASIATVGVDSGLVSAGQIGDCTVTATLGKLTATVAVSVSQAAGQPVTLTSITVSSPSDSLLQGQGMALTATGLYSNGTSNVIPGGLQWISSDTTVATVDMTGFVTAVDAGSVTITASLGTVSGFTVFDVTTGAGILEGFEVTGWPSAPVVGDTSQLTATATYADGTTADVTTQVAWKSSSKSVATVNATGLLAAIGGGSTTITASLSGFVNQYTISIPGVPSKPTLTSVAVTPMMITVPAGSTQQLSAVGIYSDGSMMVLTTGVTWATSNTAVATVSHTGLVTGVSAGTAAITATFESFVSAAVGTSVPMASSTDSTCHPVINEVQPGVSGDSTNEFIELYNPCNASVDVTDWTVSYRVTGGTSTTLVTLNKPLGAHAFVVLGYMSATGSGFTKSMDYQYSATSMSSTSGGIELAWAAKAGFPAVVADSMSYGTQTTPYNVLTQVTPAPYAGDTNPPHSIARKVDGVSSGNNAKDFGETSTPTPGEPNVITP